MLALLQEARLEALNRLLRILRESTDLTQIRLAATAILRIKPDPEPEPEVQLVTPQMLTLRAHATLATQLAKLTSSLRKAKEEQVEYLNPPTNTRAAAPDLATKPPAPTAASRLASAAGLPAG